MSHPANRLWWSMAADGLTSLSRSAARLGLVELSVKVVEQEIDPYADRQPITRPLLVVTLRRRCCTVTTSVELGQDVTAISVACPHQAVG